LFLISLTTLTSLCPSVPPCVPDSPIYARAGANAFLLPGKRLERTLISLSSCRGIFCTEPLLPSASDVVSVCFMADEACIVEYTGTAGGHPVYSSYHGARAAPIGKLLTLNVIPSTILQTGKPLSENNFFGGGYTLTLVFQHIFEFLQRPCSRCLPTNGTTSRGPLST